MKIEFFLRGLRFEFQKIRFTKLIVLTAVLIAACIAGTYISIGDTALVDAEKVQSAIDEYLSDPDGFNESYLQWQESYKLYEKALLETAKSSAVQDAELTPPSQMYKSNVYDQELYSRFYSLLYTKSAYEAKIAELIKTAEQNISASLNNRYSLEYNNRIIEIYSKTSAEVYIGLEDTRGWDVFLECPVSGLCALISVIVLTSESLCIEFSSGMKCIIFTSRYGRKKLLVTKLIYLFLCAAFILMITEGVSLFTVWKAVGLSSPANGIQAFPEYSFCPFPASVLQYVLLSFLVKLGALFLICLFAAVLSVTFQNIAVVLLLTGFSSAIVYILFLLNDNSGALPYYLNPFVHLLSTDYLNRYSAASVFGVPVSNYITVPVVGSCFGIILLVLLLSAKKSGKFGLDLKLAAVKNKIDAICRNTASAKRAGTLAEAHTLNLIYYETVKLIQPKIVALCALLILAQSAFTYFVYSDEHSEEDNILYEYMELLEGPVSAEKTEYLRKERESFDRIFASKSETDAMYENAGITIDEYVSYLDDYERALSHTKVLDEVILHDNYLNEISSQKSEPACFIYTSGYENLLDSGDDVLLLMAVFFLASRAFSIEYGNRTSVGASAYLIKSTKRGRKATDKAKIISTFLVSACAYLITSGIRIIILCTNWHFPDAGVLLYSIERFSSAGDISVFRFLVIYFTARLIVMLLMSLAIMLITDRLKGGQLIFMLAVSLLAIPYICDYAGIEFPLFLRLTEIYNLLV